MKPAGTTLSQHWNCWHPDGMPASLSVRCARCGDEARFVPPFADLFTDEGTLPPGISPEQLVRASSSLVVVLFPEVFGWHDPENPRLLKAPPREIWGVTVCDRCPARRKHRLDWPRDAFYKFEVGGTTVWAWSRESLLGLREAVAAGRGPGKEERRKDPFLQHVPRAAWEPRNRERVLRAVDRLLGEAGDGGHGLRL